MNLLFCLAALSLAAAPRPVKLVVPNASHAPYVQSVLSAAKGSPTAMRVLRSLPAPVPVVIGPQQRENYFDFDTGVIGMGKRHFAEEAAQGVPTLAHEGTHVIQKEQGVLPSDSLEMELEAYVTDFKVHRELGIAPEKGSYDERAQRAFRKGVAEFIAFVKKEYPGNVAFADYDDYVVKTGKSVERTEKRLTAKLEKSRKVLETLKGDERANYQVREVAPIEAKLHEAKLASRWHWRDRRIMTNPILRKRYRDKVHRIMKRLREEQARWAR